MDGVIHRCRPKSAEKTEKEAAAPAMIPQISSAIATSPFIFFRIFINENYLGNEDEGNQKLRDTEYRLYASRTHGGFIEDEFKKYLLKLPAGDLVNSLELAHFMPTAKERIEELKRQGENSVSLLSAGGGNSRLQITDLSR